MNKIKIRKREYQIRRGDYILFNGACHQFCAGDGRPLKFEGFHRFSTLLIPKTTVKKIPLDKLRKVTSGNQEDRTLLIKWYFDNIGEVEDV